MEESKMDKLVALFQDKPPFWKIEVPEACRRLGITSKQLGKLLSENKQRMREEGIGIKVASWAQTSDKNRFCWFETYRELPVSTLKKVP